MQQRSGDWGRNVKFGDCFDRLISPQHTLTIGCAEDMHACMHACKLRMIQQYDAESSNDDWVLLLHPKPAIVSCIAFCSSYSKTLPQASHRQKNDRTYTYCCTSKYRYSLANSSSISTSPDFAAQCMRVCPCPSLRLSAASRCSESLEQSRLSEEISLERTATRSWLAIVASCLEGGGVNSKKKKNRQAKKERT